MKIVRPYLILLFIILIVLFVFVYIGFNFYGNQASDNSMVWIGVKLKTATILKFIGIGLLLTILTYVLIKNKIKGNP